MFAFSWLEELGGRGAGVLLGLLIGAVTGWILGRWRRMRERLRILRGDARDTVVIALHLVERCEIPAGAGSPSRAGPRSLRIRSLGQAELRHVIPNVHLATVLLARAHAATPRETLISMEGSEGSYLLETLTNFVCDRTANAPFEHDLYVMAPCCEPAGLTEHQPITIILIAAADLELFEDWAICRGVHVEHSIDGARVLTLRELARRFRHEQAELGRLRHAGERTRFVETMYVLDLPLDKRAAALPIKVVPWGRFESILKEMNLE
jgi:hypothetical protein